MHKLDTSEIENLQLSMMSIESCKQTTYTNNFTWLNFIPSVEVLELFNTNNPLGLQIPNVFLNLLPRIRKSKSKSNDMNDRAPRKFVNMTSNKSSKSIITVSPFSDQILKDLHLHYDSPKLFLNYEDQKIISLMYQIIGLYFVLRGMTTRNVSGHNVSYNYLYITNYINNGSYFDICHVWIRGTRIVPPKKICVPPSQLDLKHNCLAIYWMYYCRGEEIPLELMPIKIDQKYEFGRTLPMFWVIFNHELPCFEYMLHCPYEVDSLGNTCYEIYYSINHETLDNESFCVWSPWRHEIEDNKKEILKRIAYKYII